jgi:glycosyltransferase involved in cell wall biosynthesis
MLLLLSPLHLLGDQSRMGHASVLILTLNEEVNLPRCLSSMAFSDDIVVLDSFSTDRTVEIAAVAGARVIQRKFDNWASHQNWAVESISFKHPWVFYSDADEVVTPELAEEIERVAADVNRPEVAFRVRRKDTFLGKWLRYSSMYPVWLPRLFRPERIRWERLVNPLAIINGPEGRLREHMLHYSFNKGIEAWVTKHNQYARLEAEETLKSLSSHAVDLKGLFSLGDPVRRRKALKLLSSYLPCRSILRFLYMYFFRLGFLDGWEGYTYCRLMSIYEYLIVLNIKEIEHRKKGLML